MTLRRDAIDFAHGQIHVSRAKNGASSVHPLSGVELRVRRLKRDQEPPSPFVFTSERGAPFYDGGMAQDGRVAERRRQLAGRPSRMRSAKIKDDSRHEFLEILDTSILGVSAPDNCWRYTDHRLLPVIVVLVGYHHGQRGAA